MKELTDSPLGRMAENGPQKAFTDGPILKQGGSVKFPRFPMIEARFTVVEEIVFGILSRLLLLTLSSTCDIAGDA